MTKSTASATGRKATSWDKPYPDFPLSYHSASGRLYKKIRGTRIYFGYATKNGGWEAAIEKYQRERDYLQAGRKPPVDAGGVTVADMCNAYLTVKFNKLKAGEITPSTFADCKESTDRLVGMFGPRRIVSDLQPDDFTELKFAIAKTRNPESLGNEVNRIKGIFRWAKDNRKIKDLPDYGSEFRRPSKSILRRVRAERESKFFEADEIRAMLAASNVQLRCMILLAVNGGMGNSDLGNMRMRHLDLQAGWCNYPRVKTGIPRRFPLWPDTIAAIEAWLNVRPEPKDKEAHGDLVFVTTKTRTSWSTGSRLVIGDNDGAPGKVDDLAKKCRKSADNPISKETRKLLNGLGIRRRGVSFYSLRHVFETIGRKARDKDAVRAIMGHVEAANDMGARYDEHEVDDSRLRAVTDHVRTWLFGAAPA